MQPIERAKFSAREAAVGPVYSPEDYSVSIVMKTRVIMPSAIAPKG
jgi:hypothetical protein